MFVIPFFIRNPLKSLCAWKLTPISLFLENRGKNFYQLESSESIQEWLECNGFIMKKIWTENDCCFVEIDAEKTRIKDFYSYEQLTLQQTKGTEECWKTFFVMKSDKNDENSIQSWNELIEPSIQEKLKSIQRHSP
jgi:hypothetical protein